MIGQRRVRRTTGTRLGSSEGRGWEGIHAERWRHSEGELAELEPRDTEVIVLLRGRLRIRRRGDGRLQSRHAVPGTVWLCPAGVREDMIRLYGDIEESLHLHLPSHPLTDTALRDLDVDPNRVRLHYEGGFRDPLIEQMAWALNSEVGCATPGGKLLAETLASALRVHLLRQYSGLDPAATPLPGLRGALDARRLKRVVEYIDSHLGEDLSIESLAIEACLSSFHFARAFKAATGTSPHRFVMERRVQFAKKLVREGRLPLAVITEICGFSSQSQLTRWFKYIVGITPGAYRVRC